MGNDLIPITAEGYEKIKEELKRLKTIERPAVISEISEARALGDLSENAEYHSAREKQGFIEKRIFELESKLSRLKVIPMGNKGSVDSVIFGTNVKLRELSENTTKNIELSYRIVGELEADLKNNSISLSSPLGASLINKQVGDIVSVNLPRGTREYEIISISFE